MRLGGPTVALLANDSVSGSSAGGGLLGDIPNMPAGAMAAPRLISSQSLPRPLQQRSVYGASPGLTLGLPNMLEPGGQQQQPPPQNQKADSEQQNNQSLSGVTAAGGKNKHRGGGNSGGAGDEEFESRSGSDNMDGSGDDQDNEPPRKKRYHRHTPHQIQEMEALFKECPHPDDKQRQELSRELGLEPRQVKFWFQNRRTQLKAQQERAENSMLRGEIEKLRADNVTMREAIKNASCPTCGGPATLGEMSFDEQHLRVENARLKDELDRVSALASKYLGRPIPHLSGGSGGPSSSLDLAVGGSFGGAPGGAAGGGVVHPSQGSSLVSGSSEVVPLMMRPNCVSEAEKPMIVDLAVTAMEELFRLCQPDEPSWIPSPDGPKEVLNYDEYIRQYQSALGPRPYGMRTEATRETDLVMMNSVNLVELLMDSAKWMEIFPSIVSRAVTYDVLSAGVNGNRNGALQLMFAELQVLSPLVPTREIYFVRYCKQHADGVWGVVDVSVDGLRDTSPSTNRCRRRPSGFLIQDMPNGYSKVTVLEHAEYDDRSVNRIYKAYVNSGLAFGAQRWLLTLQRQCERLASLLATSISTRDVRANPSGRRCMLKLAQRMTNNFCAGVSASTVHTWTALAGSGEEDVRVMTRKSVDNPGEPHGIVLSAATSLWLPLSPKRVFEFLRDERLRNEWDILSNGGNVEEMVHIAKGQDPGNSVSLLRVHPMNAAHNNMLILQESCTDESGSLVVYAPVDIPAMNLVMQGGDPAYVALLPSGFAILPDGQDHCGIQHDSLEVERPRTTPGCLLTVAFQILVSNVPSAKLSLESVATVNNLISCTVQKIKSALQCDNP